MSKKHGVHHVAVLAYHMLQILCTKKSVQKGSHAGVCMCVMIKWVGGSEEERFISVAAAFDFCCPAQHLAAATAEMLSALAWLWNNCSVTSTKSPGTY